MINDAALLGSSACFEKVAVHDILHQLFRQIALSDTARM